MFRIQNINNGALTGVKAMPQKDSTSDNSTDFSIGRQTFMQSYTPVQTNMALVNQKKWIGGNRDASQVTAKNRSNEIGSSLNVSGKAFSMTTYKDVNTVRNALSRVRAGGAVSPMKKNANVNNAYTQTPRFAPALPANDIIGIKYPVLYH